MAYLGQVVRYRVPAEHAQLYPYEYLAAIVTFPREDGSADLVLFVPGGESHSAENIPEGDDLGMFREAAPPVPPAEEEADEGSGRRGRHR